MEGLRGIAVLLVFFVHYSTDILPWIGNDGFTSRLATGLFIVGNTGVDLFFVLSGHLIYGALISKNRRYLQFLGRRVERIYPAFLAVFALYFLTSLFMPQASKLPQGNLELTRYLVSNMLLLPGMLPIQPLIQVAWSLSYEFFFYLACPVLIAMLRLRMRRSTTRMAAIAAISLLGFGWSFAFGASHVRLVMFGSGMLLYEICADRDFNAPRGYGMPTLMLALAGYYLMVINKAESVAAFALLFVCYFAVCHEAFTRNGLSAMLLSVRPLRWLGNMSYSFYLLHAFMIHGFFFAFRLITPARGDADHLYYLLAVPVFLVSVVGSACLFLLVERPFSLQKAAKPGATGASGSAA